MGWHPPNGAVPAQAQEPAGAQFEQAFRLRVVGPLIAAVLSVVLGGLALLIWWRQRDPLFGLYGLAEVAWSVRLLDYFVDDLAIPAELRSYVVAAAREVFLGAIARFCLLVIRVPWRWLHRTLNAYLWLALPVIAPLAAMSSHPMVFPLSWLVKVGIILTVAGAMVWGALRRPSREATLLAATVGVSAVLFLADWIKVWLTGDYYWVHSMTRYVSVPFSVVMAWMLVERYTSAVQSLQDANQVLTERVAQREAQLRAAFGRTQKIAAEETARAAARAGNRPYRDRPCGHGRAGDPDHAGRQRPWLRHRGHARRARAAQYAGARSGHRWAVADPVGAGQYGADGGGSAGAGRRR
ncbi:membrane hypothetical protein [Cupriavidus necator]|uniref:Uncharacterized protein n=1 Tax=Cupriavidus necator TaxID=106590 RepID=A0A1K0JKA2_CUPNE|nr:membrane hypothetical protein [Cupriavidus necator]